MNLPKRWRDILDNLSYSGSRAKRAVDMHWVNLKYVTDQNKEICISAIKQNKEAIHLIKNDKLREELKNQFIN